MKVHRDLLEQLMPDWQTRARARYGDMLDDRLPKDVEAIANPYHLVLKLPADCKITGMSNQIYFYSDEIAFRIESPDFVEVEPGNQLSEVQAVYQRTLEFRALSEKIPGSVEILTDRGYFLRWEGTAVETRRTYGPDGKEVTITQSFSHHAEFQHIKVSADDLGLTEATEVVAQRKLEANSPPNPLLTWYEYRAAVNLCVAYGGVAYVWKVNNAVGKEERWVLPPGQVLRWGYDLWCVNLSRGRAVLLPTSQVEVITSPLGPTNVDGVAAMEKMKSWVDAGTRFAEAADKDLKTVVGIPVDLSEYYVVKELKPRSIAPGEKLEEAGRYALPDDFAKELVRDVDKLLEGKPFCVVEMDYGVPPAWQPTPCWHCQSPTTRRLPDGVAECQDCAEKSLL